MSRSCAGPGRAGEPCAAQPSPLITVVVVTYTAASFVTDCLASLLATGYPRLRCVVVDNASPDQTAETVLAWARAALSQSSLSVEERRHDGQARPLATDLTVIRAGRNGGFAAGVNIGLAVALADPACDYVWILNPDTVVEAGAPFALARRAADLGCFAAIGARVVYRDRPDVIQADGGRLHRICGTAISVNIGRPATTPAPSADSLCYIPGVSMLVSRAFVERAGLMPEHWFLYFEEIDWQLRRGDLPLALAPDARVHHSAGASIGSAAIGRGASPTAVYFMSRNLLPFVRLWAPWKLPFAYASAYYKLVRQWGLTWLNLSAALRGLHGLGPPSTVRQRLPAGIAIARTTAAEALTGPR